MVLLTLGDGQEVAIDNRDVSVVPGSFLPILLEEVELVDIWGSDPDPDLTVANHFIKKFGGSITEHIPLPNEPGVVY